MLLPSLSKIDTNLCSDFSPRPNLQVKESLGWQFGTVPRCNQLERLLSSHVDGKVFYHLSHAPAEVGLTTDDMDEIERFFVVLYKRTSPLKKVNEARKQLFAHGNWKVENIPPTKEALHQHVKSAVFQAGYIWGQSQIANPEIPSPSDWGWVKSHDSGWCPFWTVMPEASKGCRELIKCMCKKQCSGNYKLYTANLPCTELCLCSGQCFQGEQIRND